ncbi:hypothetical protein Pst134EA_009501 [Puccinia striiformis f. sp. tritici]|uniref:Anaphase-promoting complex subunit 4 WD40 domain-containing protein n=1 Tax=Puccinia striiformis f. sp. tritici PST-78 TaxID=1165861 RepID=A0A0L0V1A5_9BASI|nr:hypothetical protein Pst134EA_009501 [Puccinia striiformis f. sp. tritici]KAH9468976.1 hypothetical protein Pst134EA_009501 [Puccinia striiformis f. sp. tritici]KNE92956.1 hypothetical protein PSTG_13670 [Puccinia striiformis f. sp. tritici PST-78]
MDAISTEPQQGPADNITGHPSYRIQFDPSQSLIKQATTKTIRSNFPSNLLRVAKWSSDGSTVLTEAEDRTIRLFMSSDCDTQVSCDDNPHRSSSWEPTADFPMADALLSTCWFPYSSINDPSRYCFVVAVKDHPIHLLDASDGRIRASYPIVDHRERMVAPHSMLFSDDGTTLFAGFDSAIEIFDVSRPGEAGERYKTIASRKCKDGQKGIITALALDPLQQGLLAAGSYSGQIALHDTKSSEIAPALVFNTTETTGVTQVNQKNEGTPLLLLRMIGKQYHSLDDFTFLNSDPAFIYESDDTLVQLFLQVKFHPQNDQVMFSVSRKSNQILCWDLRYGATTFHSFYRPGRTNQKIQFDIDWPGANLITGATDGKLRFYSLADVNQPAQEFKVHADTIGSASFNPTASTTVVTCAGSRRTPMDPSSPALLPSHLPSADPLPHQTLPYLMHPSRMTELKLWKFAYL